MLKLRVAPSSGHGYAISIYLSSLKFNSRYQQDWWRKPLVHWSVNCRQFQAGTSGDSCWLRQWLGDRHVSPLNDTARRKCTDGRVKEGPGGGSDPQKGAKVITMPVRPDFESPDIQYIYYIYIYIYIYNIYF